MNSFKQFVKEQLDYHTLHARGFKVTRREAAIIAKHTEKAMAAKAAIRVLIDDHPYSDNTALAAALRDIELRIIPRALLTIISDDNDAIID